MKKAKIYYGFVDCILEIQRCFRTLSEISKVLDLKASLVDPIFSLIVNMDPFSRKDVKTFKRIAREKGNVELPFNSIKITSRLNNIVYATELSTNRELKFHDVNLKKDSIYPCPWIIYSLFTKPGNADGCYYRTSK
jgi:hypothetical protein